MDDDAAWALIRLCSFSAAALPCAASDARTGTAPRLPFFFSMTALIATAYPIDAPGITESAMGCAVALVGFLSTRFVSGLRGSGHRASGGHRKESGIGLADVWMAGCIGAWGGPLVVTYATLIAGLLALIVSNLAKRDGKQAIAFIPYLACGAYLAMAIPRAVQ